MKIPLQKGPSHYKDYTGLEVKWISFLFIFHYIGFIHRNSGE